MSHFTLGVGSDPQLLRYAGQADKARSAALRQAVASLTGMVKARRRRWAVAQSGARPS